MLGRLGGVLIQRNRHVLDLPARDGRDLHGHLGEGQRSGAGELVELADVAIVGE